MNKIIIDVKTNDDHQNFSFNGKLKKDDQYVLVYDDMSGNTVTNNVLTFDEDLLTIVRSGAVVTEMIFQKHMLIPCEYEALSLKDSFEIYTKEYKLKNTEDRLEINLEYDLMSGAELINTFIMKIAVIK